MILATYHDDVSKNNEWTRDENEHKEASSVEVVLRRKTGPVLTTKFVDRTGKDRDSSDDG